MKVIQNLHQKSVYLLDTKKVTIPFMVQCAAINQEGINIPVHLLLFF
ncbi:hypothetical protein HMPREF9372_3689 [Sporosarcina newyorkensis 2681]|uniref:Uncharacterized protein n=1 Tax=Sporosarcina newyorkensis 2681 TaxID=1027292 RepID=F9DY08_9BACL|nr:hypothetical protein HMPREF9372_3689 [Sporosarcina newyorkensis 2681]